MKTVPVYLIQDTRICSIQALPDGKPLELRDHAEFGSWMAWFRPDQLLVMIEPGDPYPKEGIIIFFEGAPPVPS